jgi:hypothetical protein
MSAKEEARNYDGFRFCRSFMGKCCTPGSAEEKAKKFEFKGCEQMMKQFCTSKDEKFDFEAFRSKIAKFFKSTNKETDNKENN